MHAACFVLALTGFVEATSRVCIKSLILLWLMLWRLGCFFTYLAFLRLMVLATPSRCSHLMHMQCTSRQQTGHCQCLPGKRSLTKVLSLLGLGFVSSLDS